MSAALTWEIIKNNSSFLVRRGRTTFSREQGNLLNLNSPKYNGLINAKAVDITAKDKGIVLSKKSGKSSLHRKPVSTWNRVALKKDFRKVAKTISNEVSKYRPALRKAALARWSSIWRANKASAVKKTIQKKRKTTKKTTTPSK